MAGHASNWFKTGGGAKGQAIYIPKVQQKQLLFKIAMKEGGALGSPQAMYAAVQKMVSAGSLPPGMGSELYQPSGVALKGGTFQPFKGQYGPAGWSLAAPIQSALKTGRFLSKGSYDPRYFTEVDGGAAAGMVAAMPGAMKKSRQNESPTVASFGKLAEAYPEIKVGGWWRRGGDEISLDEILIPASSPNLKAIRARVKKMQAAEPDEDEVIEKGGQEWVRLWWD